MELAEMDPNPLSYSACFQSLIKYAFQINSISSRKIKSKMGGCYHVFSTNRILASALIFIIWCEWSTVNQYSSHPIWIYNSDHLEYHLLCRIVRPNVTYHHQSISPEAHTVVSQRAWLMNWLLIVYFRQVTSRRNCHLPSSDWADRCL